MCMFYSTAWAPRTSQLMSDRHSRSKMIVPIPKLRRIPTQGIACWSRRPRSAPDCNKQTPLRNCTICASPSKQLAPTVSKANLQSLPPSRSMRLRDPSTHSTKQIVATCRDKTNQDKSTDGCVKPMLTPSKSTLITMRCVRLKASCRSLPQHGASERGERTSSNHIEVCKTWMFNCTRGEKNKLLDEPNDAVISDSAPLSVIDLKYPTTKLPHVVTQRWREREFARLPIRWQSRDSGDIHRSPIDHSWLEQVKTWRMLEVDHGGTSTVHSTRC